jgi:hypothetical protein
MKGIIKRFEGDYAAIEFEGRTMVAIHMSDLPAGLREGDVIRCTNGVYVFDEQETDRIKNNDKN